MEILYINRRKRRWRFKKSVLLVAAAFLLLLFLLLYALMYLGGSVGKMRAGSIETTQSFSAVIVRRESVVQTEEFDLADRHMLEGQTVLAGERVMDVYRLGYSSETTSSLWNTRQDIYNAQIKVLGEARDVELRNYDNAIEKTKQDISNSVLYGGTEELLKLKNELSGLLAERSEYLRETIQETETLRALYRLQEEREQAVSASRIPLFAEEDGIVSYYFDDYSIPLNAEKLSNITSDLIDTAIKRSTKSLKWMGSSKTGAYRMVAPNEWYIAFNTPASQGMRVVPGEKYPLEIEGYGSFEGTAEASYVSGSKAVNIIRVNAPVGALADVRAVKAKITFNFTGIRVEKRAVQIKDGEPFVEVMLEGKRTGVYVNVHAEEGGWAIVSPKNTANAPFAEGAKYWIPKK